MPPALLMAMSIGAELPFGGRDRRGQAGGVEDVGGDCERAVSQVPHDGVELGLGAGDERNRRALAVQGAGDRLADALARAGDEGDPAGQVSVHRDVP
jgi:hypothetical protein